MKERQERCEARKEDTAKTAAAKQEITQGSDLQMSSITTDKGVLSYAGQALSHRPQKTFVFSQSWWDGLEDCVGAHRALGVL